MTGKNFLAAILVSFSFGAQAIPPIPPAAIYNKIKTIAARNCVIKESDIQVSELKDTDSIKFVLQLNKAATSGVLTLMEDGKAIESFNVICK